MNISFATLNRNRAENWFHMMRPAIFVISFVALTACTEGGIGDLSSFGDNAATIADTSNRDYYPNDQLIVEAKVQFRANQYGKASNLFKRALDVAPNDPQALLGYAAASDMLRRFDQADMAYRRLQPIIGNRIEFHNNYGYSQLLRGNLQVARRHFLIAYEQDPSNEFAANNLELLRNSVNYQRRSPGDLRGL
jgi:Flp pilus assembly protein TadD